jgi:ABC-type transporter Mla maintaining outer membrane lipid asymmetry permease subunit MlaE
MAPDSNPYAPPRTGSESETVLDEALLSGARRRGWVTYAVWLGLGSVLVGSAQAAHLAPLLSQFEAERVVSAVEGLAIVRDQAPLLAASAAVLASVTFAHHHGRARLRAPLLSIWPFFAATPAGYVVSGAIGLLFSAVVDASYGVGRTMFIEGLATHIEARDFAFGLAVACIGSAVLGAMASFALPPFHRAVPGHWQKIGIAWLVGVSVAVMGGVVRWLSSITN